MLPRSSAPGVAVVRERLAALVRQAVLRSRRPELLLRYAELPEAQDDVAVLQACVECLPAGSPQRSAAAAQLLRLRRAHRVR